ncbi:MAG: hypothetical protein WDM89_07185 [Rhizomicrobium sp.]
MRADFFAQCCGAGTCILNPIEQPPHQLFGIAARGDAFIHQRGHGAVPALADRTDPVTVGKGDIVEKHFVEFGRAIDLMNQPNGEAGRAHFHDEKT